MATLAVNGGGGAAAAPHTQAYLEGKAVKETRVLISELCRQFYTLGWVSGTGGSITIKVHDDSIPKPQQLILMSPSGLYSLPFTHSLRTQFTYIAFCFFFFLKYLMHQFFIFFSLVGESLYFDLLSLVKVYFLINFGWSRLYFSFTLYCLPMFIWLSVRYRVFLVY